MDAPSRVFFMAPWELRDQIVRAAAAKDLTVAQWLRAAAREKLERDRAEQESR